MKTHISVSAMNWIATSLLVAIAVTLFKIGLPKRLLTDKQIEKRYVRTGTIFGDAVSYTYIGECMGFNSMLAAWERWEAEYAKRGYRTLPIDDFIDAGGYGKALLNLGIKRAPDEKPIFHACVYRERYLGKITPVIDLSAKKPQTGTYFPPSTKEIPKR